MTERDRGRELAGRQSQFDSAYTLYHIALEFEGNDLVQAPLLLAAARDRRGGFFPLLPLDVTGIKFKEGCVVSRSGDRTQNGPGVISIAQIIASSEAIVEGSFTLTKV